MKTKKSLLTLLIILCMMFTLTGIITVGSASTTSSNWIQAPGYTGGYTDNGDGTLSVTDNVFWFSHHTYATPAALNKATLTDVSYSFNAKLSSTAAWPPLYLTFGKMGDSAGIALKYFIAGSSSEGYAWNKVVLNGAGYGDTANYSLKLYNSGADVTNYNDGTPTGTGSSAIGDDNAMWAWLGATTNLQAFDIAEGHNFIFRATVIEGGVLLRVYYGTSISDQTLFTWLEIKSDTTPTNLAETYFGIGFTASSMTLTNYTVEEIAESNWTKDAENTGTFTDNNNGTTTLNGSSKIGRLAYTTPASLNKQNLTDVAYAYTATNLSTATEWSFLTFSFGVEGGGEINTLFYITSFSGVFNWNNTQLRGAGFGDDATYSIKLFNNGAEVVPANSVMQNTGAAALVDKGITAWINGNTNLQALGTEEHNFIIRTTVIEGGIVLRIYCGNTISANTLMYELTVMSSSTPTSLTNTYFGTSFGAGEITLSNVNVYEVIPSNWTSAGNAAFTDNYNGTTTISDTANPFVQHVYTTPAVLGKNEVYDVAYTYNVKLAGNENTDSLYTFNFGVVGGYGINIALYVQKINDEIGYAWTNIVGNGGFPDATYTLSMFKNATAVVPGGSVLGPTTNLDFGNGGIIAWIYDTIGLKAYKTSEGHDFTFRATVVDGGVTLRVYHGTQIADSALAFKFDIASAAAPTNLANTYFGTGFFNGTATISNVSVVELDTVKPVISWTAPANVKEGDEITVNPTATDNASAADKITVSTQVKLGEEAVSLIDNKFIAKIGEYTVTVTATDENGNVATEVYTFNSADNTKPEIVIGVPSTVTEGDEVSIAPTVTDNYSTTDKISVSISVTLGGEPVTLTNNKFTANVGEYIITVTATDEAGNTATATQTVESLAEVIPDTTAPTITLELPQTVAEGTEITVVPQVSDNVSYAENISVNVSVTLGSEPVILENGKFVAQIGTYTITVTATDEANNKANETYTIIATDNTKPEITLEVADTVTEGDVVEITASATDNYSTVDNISVSISVTLGGEPVTLTDNKFTAGVGEYAVTVTATDEAGNIATKTATVTAIEIPKTNWIKNGDYKGTSYDVNSEDGSVTLNTAGADLFIQQLYYTPASLNEETVTDVAYVYHLKVNSVADGEHLITFNFGFIGSYGINIAFYYQDIEKVGYAWTNTVCNGGFPDATYSLGIYKNGIAQYPSGAGMGPTSSLNWDSAGIIAWIYNTMGLKAFTNDAGHSFVFRATAIDGGVLLRIYYDTATVANNNLIYSLKIESSSIAANLADTYFGTGLYEGTMTVSDVTVTNDIKDEGSVEHNGWQAINPSANLDFAGMNQETLEGSFELKNKDSDTAGFWDAHAGVPVKSLLGGTVDATKDVVITFTMQATTAGSAHSSEAHFWFYLWNNPSNLLGSGLLNQNSIWTQGVARALVNGSPVNIIGISKDGDMIGGLSDKYESSMASLTGGFSGSLGKSRDYAIVYSIIDGIGVMQRLYVYDADDGEFDITKEKPFYSSIIYTTETQVFSLDSAMFAVRLFNTDGTFSDIRAKQIDKISEYPTGQAEVSGDLGVWAPNTDLVAAKYTAEADGKIKIDDTKTSNSTPGIYGVKAKFDDLAGGLDYKSENDFVVTLHVNVKELEREMTFWLNIIDENDNYVSMGMFYQNHNNVYQWTSSLILSNSGNPISGYVVEPFGNTSASFENEAYNFCGIMAVPMVAGFNQIGDEYGHTFLVRYQNQGENLVISLYYQFPNEPVNFKTQEAIYKAVIYDYAVEDWSKMSFGYRGQRAESTVNSCKIDNYSTLYNASSDPVIENPDDGGDKKSGCKNQIFVEGYACGVVAIMFLAVVTVLVKFRKKDKR